MNRSFIFPTVIFLAAWLLATGCTANRQYRTSYDLYNQSVPDRDPTDKAVIETTPEYKLGFVEFDEEGWFWDPKQVKTVEEMIGVEAQISQTNSTGIIMVVFVHGWKNNAAYNCTNVNMFRATLGELSKAEQIKSGDDQRAARKVVGIYCGWRGLSEELEPFKELSMWNRKATAHKVGGYGAMTQLFVELERLQTLSNNQIAADGAKTELIIVGHSFGGAAVYSAISQFITERFVDNVENGQPLKPLGDQVILLNPAFEASRHYNLNYLATNIAKYPDLQRPVLSIFTSEGDWATHYLLPIGQFFPTLFEKTRNSFQRDAAREAVGWFEPYVTHHLAYDTNSVLGGTNLSTYNPHTKKHELHTPDKLRASVQNVHDQRQKWHPNGAHPQTYYFDDCRLEPKQNFRPGDPFLVVSVDKKIMADHNDITNPVLINFLREYIEFCQNPLVRSGK